MRRIACLFLVGLPLAVHAEPKIGYAHATVITSGRSLQPVHPNLVLEGNLPEELKQVYRDRL